MMRVPVFSLLHILMFHVLMGLTASAQGQVRPQSDSSTANPDHSGTNYMKENKSSDQLTKQNLSKFLQDKLPQGLSMTSTPRRSTSSHIVAPTSDQANKSETSRFTELLQQVSPALVASGDLEAYTNYRIVRPNVDVQHYNVSSPSGTRPATIRSVYKTGDTGGSGVIAIVDAYHYPNAASDIAKFSSTFNLPQLSACPDTNPFSGASPCLRIESNPNSPIDCGWNGESALDLEWAHAVAPNASILFIEAASSRNADLYASVAKARDEIGGFHGELSMSWGTSGEAIQTAAFESTFTDGVLYFAASGDTGGQLGFPADFPNVIAVGGTVLYYKTDGTLAAEVGWPDSGGGVSTLEKPSPQYQTGVENVDPNGRNTPDMAAVSDANPAVAVYVSTPVGQCQDHPAPDQYQSGWTQLIGTSLAAPVVAAMVNVAAHHRTTVMTELQAIYGNRKDPLRIRDITLMNGIAGGNAIKPGYDNVTGVGAPASMDFDADPPH